MRKFGEIIERIEYVRTYLGLNKSRFSGEIGMKPQTYNNFIGSQGSKPNIELIHGIVNRFQVNPIWLLNGTGSAFVDPDWEPGMEETGSADMPAGRLIRNGEPGRGLQDSKGVQELRDQIKSLEPVLEEAEKRIREVESSQIPLLNALIKILGRYIEIDPVGATREIKGLSQRLDRRLSRVR